MDINIRNIRNMIDWYRNSKYLLNNCELLSHEFWLVSEEMEMPEVIKIEMAIHFYFISRCYDDKNVRDLSDLVLKVKTKSEIDLILNRLGFILQQPKFDDFPIIFNTEE